MKVSCTPISLARTFKTGEMDIEDFIEFCAELEIDGIDVMDSRSYPWCWRNPERELRELSAHLKKNGLQLAAFACGNDFTHQDTTAYNDNVDKVKNALREAGSVGAPLLRIFGGKHPNPNAGGDLSHAKALERVLEGIERCLPEAEKCGVVMALENHGCLPGHSYEITRIIQHFDSPHLKCMFDVANFIANNMDEIEDPLRAYENLRNEIVHVHFKDFATAPLDSGQRVAACLAGNGLIPLRQFAAMLEADGYQGFCSLEYEAAAICPEREGVTKCIQYMNEIRAVQNLLPERA